MTKRTIIFLSLLVLVIAGLGFIKYLQIQTAMAMMAGSAPPASSVEVITARQLQWQPRLSAIGTLTAREGIDVKNEVEGIIEKIHIESGQQVKKGDLLISLNDDVEQADLASFNALEELALSQFKRNKSMWKNKTISESDYDNTRSALEVARAQVTQTKARIAKKSIQAPFSGVLGIKHVSTGQYVPPGSMLVSLQDYHVLYADFAVPDKYLPDISIDLDVQLLVSAYADRKFTGKVKAIDAKVDEATRNINVRAQLLNEDNLLRPGMYADINLFLNQLANRVVVPATAIIYSSFGDALFIVEKNEAGDLVAKRIQVVTGERRGDLVAITAGLKGGESVVQAGAHKLKNKSLVTVNEQARLKESNNEVY